MKHFYRFIKRFNLFVATLRNCEWLLKRALLLWVLVPLVLTGSQMPPPFDGLNAPAAVVKADTSRA